MAIERHPHLPGRAQVSHVLAAGQIAVAVIYFFPSLIAPARPGTLTVVAQLAQIGPIWTVWFGTTGLALIAALRTHKLLHVAHIATGSSWIGFCFALEVGAIANHGSHVFPIAAALLGAVNLVVAGSYSRDVGRREPR